MRLSRRTRRSPVFWPWPGAGWLAFLADKDEMALTPALRRDLGLPAAADGFRIDAERSRLGV